MSSNRVSLNKLFDAFAITVAFLGLRIPACIVLLGLSLVEESRGQENAILPMPAKIPSLSVAKESLRDVWGEMAMAQPDGASYEFFEPLLPPPRYVHADFRYYPIVMSAPRARAKARLVSNGSGVNLRGGSRSWMDVGTPITFRVGPDEFQFGGLADRVSDPKLKDGWLPIYEILYRHPYPVQSEGLVPIDQKPVAREAEVYRLEAFAATDAAFAEHAVVFVRFSLAEGKQGLVTIERGDQGEAKPSNRAWLDSEGKTITSFDTTWSYERKRMHAKLTPGSFATLAIATVPIENQSLLLTKESFTQQQEMAERTWREILEPSLKIEVAEERINDAWKNLLIQNWQMLQGDRMFYSASNQYQQLYVSEGSDAVLSMLQWGFGDLAKEIALPIIDYRRKGLEHHQAGLKLLAMARLWWLTRDRDWFLAQRSRWEPELERLMADRTDEDFLLPKGRYCGDIATMVHALSVEGKGWKALHDWSVVLRELEEPELASRIGEYAANLKIRLMSVLEKSFRRDIDPPFIPNALLDREEPHSPITSTRIGSYWNLMTGFFLESRLYETGSNEEAWLPSYLESHGGLCMGMVRSGGTAHGFWTGAERTNPLYGTRYVLDTLRRDEPDRALVSFYGMLAHGFTRQTLVAGEGCTLEPVDAHGRFFYCPPNSAGNAHFLTMLRNLLVQDFDIDGDGIPETLRLLSAASRRWLRDGETIEVKNALTAFGPVSLRAESKLSEGYVDVDIELPNRNRPESVIVRPRLPEAWMLTNATVDGRQLAMSVDGQVDIRSMQGRVRIRFACKPTSMEKKP